jgi:hypothetical protein
MATRFAGRQHAHEKTVGALAVHDDHLLLERFGMGEDDDGRCLGRLGRSDARKTGNRKERNAHQKPPFSPEDRSTADIERKMNAGFEPWMQCS